MLAFRTLSLGCLLLFLTAISRPLFAEQSMMQVSKLDHQVNGYWTLSNTDQVDWQASWIWGQNTQGVRLFRRTFQLNAPAKEATIRITASSIYRFFVNGKAVHYGPARSAPHHQSYDILDITSLLQSGKNVIAVKAHFQPEVGSYVHPARAGLLVQLDVLDQHNNQRFIGSDHQWRTIQDPQWLLPEVKMSRFHQQVNDRVSILNKLKHWMSANYDDSSWHPATMLWRNSGWPKADTSIKPSELVTPWTKLVPRSIPYLQHKVISQPKLLSFQTIATNLTGKSSQLEKRLNKIPKVKLVTDGPQVKSAKSAWAGGSLRLPKSNQSYLLVFDLGKAINGFPYLKMQGAKGTKVEVVAKPFMLDEQFSYHTIDSNLIDQVSLSGETDEWRSLYFKPVRYLGLVISNSEKESTLYEVGVEQMSYPFEFIGRMESPQNNWLEAFTAATANTIKAATTDAYTDNYRERRQYSQTGYYAALGNYYLFGDSALQKRYLLQVAQEQLANGLMPAYAPLMSRDFMVILDSNLFWLRSLYSYALYTGDLDFVTNILPSAEKLLDFIFTYTNADGLIDEPPYAYWLDHAQNDRRGANLTLNGHFLGALEDMAQVYSWLNQEFKGEQLLRQASKIRQSIETQFWDKNRAFFVDAAIKGQPSKQISEHGNAMVLALNIGTEKQRLSVVKHLLSEQPHNFIKRENGMTLVTPAMSYFLHKGLAEQGFIDESLQLFRDRFEHMLAPNTNQTLWEEWWLNGTGRSGKFVNNGRTRSDAQTESAFAPALFAEYLFGVQPIAPGWRKVRIQKMPHKLEHLKAEIPTPLGLLKIRWDKSTLNLDVPVGMEIEVIGGKGVETRTIKSAGKHRVLVY